MRPTMMENLVSLAKRRGFIFPSSELYGGINAVYDYGPLGALLKNNIKKLWWKHVVQLRDDMVGIDSAILMNTEVWKASGHIQHFRDPLVECKSCHKRFRADHILLPNAARPKHEREPAVGSSKVCPECDGELTDVRMFNTMFKTFFGPVEDEGAIVYLRPETAQGMFVNFKNVVDSARMRIPFGIAQIGKAFRNEITTGNFLFRLREFEQMEIEYFIHPSSWQEHFEGWLEWMRRWMAMIGLDSGKIHEHEIPDGERAHYSKRTVDIEYEFPFGQSELYGIAYRTDFDLSAHERASGVSLEYRDPASGEAYVPHVIEPTFGLDRTVLAVLLASYHVVEGGRTTTTQSTKDEEVVLKLPKQLAPFTVAVLPLSKKKELIGLANEIAGFLRQSWMVAYDESGSIGRRYRRQDEIGTPYCITVDFESIEDRAVTVRDRDTMKQERIATKELLAFFQSKNL